MIMGQQVSAMAGPENPLTPALGVGIGAMNSLNMILAYEKEQEQKMVKGGER